MAIPDKEQKVAAALAFLGALQPTPIPLTFLHKLYLRQYGWGALYLLLGFTQIPRIACAVEGVWYLSGGRLPAALAGLFSSPPRRPAATVNPQQVGAIATALRELDRLRHEGLMTEYEFEQKRRRLLDQISEPG